MKKREVLPLTLSDIESHLYMFHIFLSFIIGASIVYLLESIPIFVNLSERIFSINLFPYFKLQKCLRLKI